MPRKIIEKILPCEQKIRKNKIIKLLGDKINGRHIWHLDIDTVSRGVAIGWFIGWLPIPIQMISAGLSAIYFKANLPISLGVAWFSNPLTMPFLFSGAYVFGCWLLNIPTVSFNLEDVMSNLGELYIAMFIGCLVLGIVFSIVGYFTTRWWWIHTVRKKKLTKK